MKRLVVCRNPECHNSLERAGANAVPMECIREHFSAWVFKCRTCGLWRAVTKDQVGGTVGSGDKTDTGRNAYQPGRYVGGISR